jgi:hypothetical protein
MNRFKLRQAKELGRAKPAQRRPRRLAGVFADGSSMLQEMAAKETTSGS